MIIKYQIFENDKMLVQKFIGEFSIKQYFKYAQHISNLTNSLNINKVLIDFRDIKFSNIKVSNLNKLDKVIEIRKELTRNKTNNPDTKHVIWVDKPFSTAIIQLFVDNFPHMKYTYCSSINNVLRELDAPEYFYDLDGIIENLQKEYIS